MSGASAVEARFIKLINTLDSTPPFGQDGSKLRNIVTFINSLKSKFQSSPVVPAPTPGLYHYVRENEQEKSRVHLRVDPDGTGTLIVNASSVMHLNPTAADMAWLVLEEKTSRRVSPPLQPAIPCPGHRPRSDLTSFSRQLDELLRPDGACPIHELELDSLMPFSARPSAPYRMDLAVTYRCNNDCAHCYNARERNFPELTTEQWFRSSTTYGRWVFRTWSSPAAKRPCATDLPELIRHAEANGQITGLNTNARRLMDEGYVQQLGGCRARPCPGHGGVVRRTNPR